MAVFQFGWKLTSVISNSNVAASLAALAIAKYTVFDAIEVAQRDGLNYGSRKNGEQKQRKGRKQQDRQRSGWPQHDGDALGAWLKQRKTTRKRAADVVKTRGQGNAMIQCCTISMVLSVAALVDVMGQE